MRITEAGCEDADFVERELAASRRGAASGRSGEQLGDQAAEAGDGVGVGLAAGHRWRMDLA